MGPELLRIDPQPVIAVLTLNVGVIFNIGKDVQSSPDTGLREILSDGIDAAALGTANHPSETVNHAQRLFNTNYRCYDRNNLASTQPQLKSR
jgi:hypothetical protein